MNNHGEGWGGHGEAKAGFGEGVMSGKIILQQYLVVSSLNIGEMGRGI